MRLQLRRSVGESRQHSALTPLFASNKPASCKVGLAQSLSAPVQGPVGTQQTGLGRPVGPQIGSKPDRSFRAVRLHLHEEHGPHPTKHLLGSSIRSPNHTHRTSQHTTPTSPRACREAPRRWTPGLLSRRAGPTSGVVSHRRHPTYLLTASCFRRGMHAPTPPP